MNANLSRTPAKETMFVTAKATVSCAEFNAGEYVGVRFYHYGTDGQPWYLIDRTEKGALRNPVAYPKCHLTQFGL